MLPVIELFTSIQGEGKYTGVPSHFVRVSGCNLRCVFRNSICDTAYSSFKPEKPLYGSDEELLNAFENLCKENPMVNHIVVTGGEPLLYRKDLEDFLSAVQKKHNFVITIETNGTMPPINPLSKGVRVDMYSVSPKLKTAVMQKPGVVGGFNITQEDIDRQHRTRINISNLIDLVMFSNDYQFKFVYSGVESLIEIDGIYQRMGEEVEKRDCIERAAYYQKHPNHNTMLMPEGQTEEQLTKSRKEIVDICVDRGWRMTDREHIIIWGSQRGK